METIFGIIAALILRYTPQSLLKKQAVFLILSLKPITGWRIRNGFLLAWHLMVLPSSDQQ